MALVLDNADAFVDAMVADFGTRPKTGSLFTEIIGMISVIEHTRSHVPQWMRATKLMRAARLFGLKAEVQPSPLGVIGIIGPWNFPLNLVVLPATAAFAAGNRVMIKMSEITPETAELMTATAPKYFDATFRGMFPSIVSNDDYCSSVNQANFERVVGLIDDARVNGASVETVAPDGESLPDRGTRKIAPTIVRDVNERMRIAGEEIFGPVLVVRPYSQLTDAIDYINQRPAPLVAYWYGLDNDDFRSFVRNTRSGGVARNDFAAQMIPSAAPFDGVGRSGMGAYHGKAGFDAFSHYHAVVGSDLPFSITGRAAPPFSPSMRAGAGIALRMARNRTRRRLKRR
jgi:acyl-CoA reductase-like NAD-dependent aldehyde dehydrogenase